VTSDAEQTLLHIRDEAVGEGQDNINNNITYLTAIGLSPVGNGYLTCIQV
jgi:hypothetical protein